MKTQVTFRHLKTNTGLQDAANETVSRFEKFYDGITSTEVVFTNDNDKIVEFTVQVLGNTIVAKEGSDDFHKSLNEASGKIIRQLKKWKKKNISN
jgi:ribosomal subunit interface protein